MKTILLCIITSVFFISCSADSDFVDSENLAKLPQEISVEKYCPQNPANPYDLQGRKIYEGLSAYYKNRKSPNSVSELAEQIRFISADLGKNNTPTSRLIPFTDEMVESIMEDPDNSMILIVQNSTLGTYTKNNLISFLQNLIDKRQEEFSISYNYITGYETDVLNDTIFTSDERETVLTVSSISRYSLYSEQERKDKDWDILIGNRVPNSFFIAGETSLISIIALVGKVLQR